MKQRRLLAVQKMWLRPTRGTSSGFSSVQRPRTTDSQHAGETEPVDRLAETALLDPARDCRQARGIERDRRGGTQEGELTELGRQLVVAHRQIAFDLVLRDQPGHRGLLVAELIDQLEIERLPPGEDTAVGDLVEL